MTSTRPSVPKPSEKLPHNLNAERAVLGSMILDREHEALLTGLDMLSAATPQLLEALGSDKVINIQRYDTGTGSFETAAGSSLSSLARPSTRRHARPSLGARAGR